MSDLPSPPAARLRSPRWLDARLLAGVLLVLGSVVVGARLVAMADDTQPLWAAASDLSAGSTLAAADLVAVDAQVPDATTYLAAVGDDYVGLRLTRDVGRGELVAASAVTGEDQDYRLVTVPVARGHFPPGLDKGAAAFVDVYVTVKPRGAGVPGQPQKVIDQVEVVAVEKSTGFGAGGGTVPVVLRIPADRADRVVAAVQAGEIDLVRRAAAKPAAG